MRVVVASGNPVKVGAVKAAFELKFEGDALSFESVNVPSGVPDQPMGDSETSDGAVNRAQNARAAMPEADFWVGLEGGIDEVGGKAFTFAWMAIVSKDGQLETGRSLSLPLPDRVLELVKAGTELGYALDEVFATTNIKHQGGAFGLLSDNYITRQSVYTDTLVCTLLPFVNPAYKA
ncbi:non-canonical purine NTP phosphatase [Rhodobacteraceae bacterium RKSG542]|uniref:inosine/xanthosine triphosphatase n=1 Tax=Pseudovibrio flavus TaxID=2529854 RepID=UPI0012BC991D|nr:inosine/xanthosine triphosphatase [Pseudovibrio flavus]MTI17406.1 non-canonical purine NTP phosphatase [Pseudovibrio flavus]